MRRSVRSYEATSAAALVITHAVRHSLDHCFQPPDNVPLAYAFTEAHGNSA